MLKREVLEEDRFVLAYPIVCMFLLTSNEWQIFYSLPAVCQYLTLHMMTAAMLPVTLLQ